MEMIKVKFELLGIIKSPYGKKFEIEVKKGTTIGDFLTDYLKYKKEIVKFFVSTVAGKKERMETVIKNGDNVVIFHPVAGG